MLASNPHLNFHSGNPVVIVIFVETVVDISRIENFLLQLISHDFIFRQLALMFCSKRVFEIEFSVIAREKLLQRYVLRSMHSSVLYC